MIGKTLGNRYSILEEIGGGGMAVVYKARCNLLNRIVAIKVLRPEFSNDEEFVRRFRREAQAAASLSHPNIVGIYDVGEEDHLHYIVMEYVEGKTLKELIREKAPMNLLEVIEIGKQICDALECAHRNKIIHRDIKSHNIIINSEGRVKVTDFGIARAATGATITNTGNNIFGSVHYFSPEQAKGETVDERSDIYSLGVILYEAFTGKLPFEGQTPVAVALKQIQERPRNISEIIPGFPPALELIIQKCLSKDPENRFQSAAQLKEELTQVAEDPAVKYFDSVNLEHTLILDKGSNQLPGKNNGMKKKKRNSPLKIIGMALLALILFAVFAWIGGNLARKYLEVPEIAVPNVVGLSEEEAAERLKEKNLKFTVIDRVHDDAPIGQVIAQDPEANSIVKVNHPGINLIVSKGPKTAVVPKIIGLSEQEGITLIKNSGFQPGSISQSNSDEFPEGIIMDQNPRAGLELPEDTLINFVVSLGPEFKQINVPSLIGRNIDEAIKILAEQNIKVGEITKKPSDVSENTVIDQNPKAGESMDPNGKIDLVVSSGPLKMKNINLDIRLPSEPEEFTVTIKVSDDLGSRTVYSQKHRPEDSPLQVTVEGAGEMHIEVWLDDKLFFEGVK